MELTQNYLYIKVWYECANIS